MPDAVEFKPAVVNRWLLPASVVDLMLGVSKIWAVQLGQHGASRLFAGTLRGNLVFSVGLDKLDSAGLIRSSSCCRDASRLTEERI